METEQKLVVGAFVLHTDSKLALQVTALTDQNIAILNNDSRVSIHALKLIKIGDTFKYGILQGNLKVTGFCKDTSNDQQDAILMVYSANRREYRIDPIKTPLVHSE